jgi:hypothetical protein
LPDGFPYDTLHRTGAPDGSGSRRRPGDSAGVLLWEAYDLNRSLFWVDHTGQVISSSRRILKFTAKGESGTGLGRWITSDILSKHEGKTRLRSSRQPSRSGTCFSVFFPSRVPADRAPLDGWQGYALLHPRLFNPFQKVDVNESSLRRSGDQTAAERFTVYSLQPNRSCWLQTVNRTCLVGLRRSLIRNPGTASRRRPLRYPRTARRCQH